MYAIHAQAHISSIFGPICMNFGSMPKIKFYDHLIFYLSSLRRKVDEFGTLPLGAGVEGGVKNLGNGWSKSIVLK